MPHSTLPRSLCSICIIAIGSSLIFGLIGCQSSGSNPKTKPEPQPQIVPRETVPVQSVNLARADFIRNMAASFTDVLGQRVKVEEQPYRLLVALEKPDRRYAEQIDTFISALLGNTDFSDNFALVILEQGQGVESLSDDTRGPRLPDGQPVKRQYPPDAIYLTRISYSEIDLPSNPRFGMHWRVTHPNSGRIIINRNQQYQLLWSDGTWELVNINQ